MKARFRIIFRPTGVILTCQNIKAKKMAEDYFTKCKDWREISSVKTYPYKESDLWYYVWVKDYLSFYTLS